jgi:hypothetical protein
MKQSVQDAVCYKGSHQTNSIKNKFKKLQIFHIHIFALDRWHIRDILEDGIRENKFIGEG